jgi:hypothetical protein
MAHYKITEEKTDEFHEFNVDKAQVMKNLSDHYTIPLEDAVIVENIDNCIDESAYSKIECELSKDSLIIKMIGTGIQESVFENLLHTLAGTTKTDKPGLGHYGWGMKVGLAISEYMTIGTKRGNFSGAQEWRLDQKGTPKWKPIEKPIFSEDMTIIQHKLRPEYLKTITPKSLKKTIQYYYPTVIGGAPVNGRMIEFLLNGEKIEPQIPPYEKKKSIKIKIGTNEATGKIFFAKKGFDDDFDKIKIIVYGRRILDDTFGIPTNNKISGYIHADMLYKIVATDKTAVQRTTPMWRNFAKEGGKFLSEYLKEVGELKEDTAMDADLLKHLHDEINNTLKQFPDLFGEFRAGTNKISKPVLIPDPDGEMRAMLLPGGQETLGNFTGPGNGDGVSVEGIDNPVDAPQDIKGITPTTRKHRKVKVGVQIRHRPFQGSNREAIFDYANSTVWINTEFPTFRKAAGQNKKVVEYHTVRCIFDALLEHVITAKGKTNIKDFLDYRADILSKWCNT